MLNGFISVFVVFLILGTGFFFTRKQLWPDNTNKVFSTTVVKIAAPSLAVVSIAGRFTPEMLRASIWNLLIISASTLLMHFIGMLFARLFKLEPKKKAVFITTFTFNNTMFIGLPIIQIVFGREGLPYLFTFYLVSIVFFWSLGASTLAKASDTGGQKAFSLRRIVNPGLMGVIVGCILAGFEIPIPMILETVLTYFGDLCVPLSLLVIGANLAHSLSKGKLSVTKDQICILFGKFLLHPLIVLGLFTVFGVTGFPLHVFILTAAMPCHAQTAILAEFYDVEGEYASNVMSLSTLVSLIMIPVYAGILT